MLLSPVELNEHDVDRESLWRRASSIDWFLTSIRQHTLLLYWSHIFISWLSTLGFHYIGWEYMLVLIDINWLNISIDIKLKTLKLVCCTQVTQWDSVNHPYLPTLMQRPENTINRWPTNSVSLIRKRKKHIGFTDGGFDVHIRACYYMSIKGKISVQCCESTGIIGFKPFLDYRYKEHVRWICSLDKT